MACSRRDEPEAGYAAPAAMVISLALALTVTAATGASTAELRLARADLRRTQAEYMLAGAHTTATVAMLSSSQSGRLRWRLPGSGEAVEVLAEPEAAKLGLDRASVLEDTALRRLGVGDPDGVRAKLLLASGAKAHARGLIRRAETAPVWRECALSAISPYGAAGVLGMSAAEDLSTRSAGPTWRAGEVWRVRVSARGWTDDRIIRFTGDPRHPAAVVEREFGRASSGGEPCRALIEAGSEA